MSISFEEFVERQIRAAELLNRNVRLSLIKNALRMEADAKLNATGFPKVQTGRLRNSIQGIVGKSFAQGGFYILLRAGGLSMVDDAAFYAGERGADVNYAKVQEFGGGEDNIIPKFYLRRSRDKNMPKLERDIQRALKLSLQGKFFR
tara:strand:+ start:7041 stop:7481 length:441 start_codon:yes stop_codon:yes gene_type:complete